MKSGFLFGNNITTTQELQFLSSPKKKRDTVLVLQRNQFTEEIERAKWELVNDQWEVYETPPRWALAWKRMFLQMEWTQLQKTSLMIEFGMEEARKTKAEKAFKEWQRLSGGQELQARRQEQATKSKGRVKQVKCKGPPKEPPAKLPKGQQAWKYTRENCPHLEESLSEPRGGRNDSHWLTCLDCGQRWENIVVPNLEPARPKEVAPVPAVLPGSAPPTGSAAAAA